MQVQKTFARSVPHDLTEQEVLDSYDQAHALEREADSLTEELKESSKEQKAQVTRLRLDAKHKREAASARKEMRAVACYEELRGSQVMVIRADTNEVIDQRPATEADQQQTFPGLDQETTPFASDYVDPVAEADRPNGKKTRKPRKTKSQPAVAAEQ